MLGETGRQVMGPIRGSGDFLAYGSPSISAFRAGHNLKHLHHARIAIKGKAYAGVNGGTGEVCGSGGKLSDGSIDVDSD